MSGSRPPTTQAITAPSTETLAVLPPEETVWRRIHSNGALVAGGTLLLLIVAWVTLSPVLLNLDPYAVDPSQRLQGPGAEHLLGTDNVGRDLFARIVVGARTSLIVGTSVALLSGMIGTVIGLLASAFTVLDHILMRICDGLMAIPAVLLAVALAAALGPSVPNLILALTIVFTPTVARLVRSRALGVMSETFVEASRAQGANMRHIITKHTFPNVLSVLAVQITFIFADSIITEAALSFLGAGVPTPEPSWGNILYDGKSVILQAPIMTIIASLTLIFTVLAINLLGDGLRDLVDPRARQRTKRSMFSRLFGGSRPATRFAKGARQ